MATSIHTATVTTYRPLFVSSGNPVSEYHIARLEIYHEWQTSYVVSG